MRFVCSGSRADLATRLLIPPIFVRTPPIPEDLRSVPADPPDANKTFAGCPAATRSQSAAGWLRSLQLRTRVRHHLLKVDHPTHQHERGTNLNVQAGDATTSAGAAISHILEVGQNRRSPLQRSGRTRSRSYCVRTQQSLDSQREGRRKLSRLAQPSTADRRHRSSPSRRAGR